MHETIKERLEQAENSRAFFVWYHEEAKTFHLISRNSIDSINVTGEPSSDDEAGEIEIYTRDDSESAFTLKDLQTRIRFMHWLSMGD
jgi:hypothetical protein